MSERPARQWALWGKACSDARGLLGSLTLLVFTFVWLFVWLSSKIELPAFSDFLLNALPRHWERLSGVPFREVATPAGRIALAYVDPVILFSFAVWAIARGSDSVAGEINRGTMEMLLAQPVRRITIFTSHAVVTVVGAAILAAAAWLGTCAGIKTVELPGEVSMRAFWPAAVNLFGMCFYLAGLSTLVSSWESYRWRVIGVLGGYYVVSLILKLVGRMAPDYGWVAYGSFLTAFEPQALVAQPEEAIDLLVRYNSVLIGLGLASYVIAAVIFCRRDLPAPL